MRPFSVRGPFLFWGLSPPVTQQIVLRWSCREVHVDRKKTLKGLTGWHDILELSPQTKSEICVILTMMRCVGRAVWPQKNTCFFQEWMSQGRISGEVMSLTDSTSHVCILNLHTFRGFHVTLLSPSSAHCYMTGLDTQWLDAVSSTLTAKYMLSVHCLLPDIMKEWSSDRPIDTPVISSDTF